MKKYLLMGIAFGIGSTAFTQGNAPMSVTLQKINPTAACLAKPAQKKRETFGGALDSFESLVNSLGTSTYTHPASTPGTRSFTPVNIGTTWYQNQTNSSICNRIIKNSDGTICATWTFAALSTWADRGTGYNYFDGTSWGPAPSV